jgi:hypothetical protein
MYHRKKLPESPHAYTTNPFQKSFYVYVTIEKAYGFILNLNVFLAIQKLNFISKQNSDKKGL